MTLRACMLSVLVAALLLAGGLRINRWYDYLEAERKHCSAKYAYNSGTIALCKYVEASERLMKTEIRLHFTRFGRMRVMAEHKRRVERVIEEELRNRVSCRGFPAAEIIEAREPITQVDSEMVRLGQ